MLSSTERTGCLQAELKLLRSTEHETDGVVLGGDSVCKVRCNIVCWLSPAFLDVFMKNKVGNVPSLDTSTFSTKAVSVMLDFAYGVDVSPALSSDAALLTDVGLLANKYEISQLTIIVSDVAF